MHNAETTHRIRRVIANTGSLLVDPASLGEDDDLYAAGLKSLAAVHLMLALEAEFGIEFPASALHRSAFSTIARIGDLVESLAPRTAAAARK
jgi:acyl carrier protein